ncbi:MAG: hypothetical protein ACPGD5_07740 [Salibacteraceae bacterium]
MKNPTLFLFLLLIFSLTSCKKEDDEIITTSNIDKAPSVVDQEFQIEIIVGAERVYEKIMKSGNAEFSRTTFKYEGDTITEVVFELRKKSMERKHVLVDNLIVATIDSVYGPDTVQYFRQISYEYLGTEMQRMVVDQFNIQADKTIDYVNYEHKYIFENQNMTSVNYESANSNDSLPCTDTYQYNSYSSDIDVHNLLGISQSSSSKNLISKSNHSVDCNGNGSEGSTQYEYWYNVNSNKRITELVYSKTFNNTVTSFRETYQYTIR